MTTKICQHGTQLLDLVNHWTEALDNDHSMDWIYIDFPKAFVPHQRLQRKVYDMASKESLSLGTGHSS